MLNDVASGGGIRPCPTRTGSPAATTSRRSKTGTRAHTARNAEVTVAEAVDWIRHAEWQLRRGNLAGGLHAAYTAIEFSREARDRLVELLAWQDDAQGLAVSS